MCTKEALMAVCDKVILVPGNSRMRTLGEDVKNMVEGTCCVYSCRHVCMHVHNASTFGPTPGVNFTTEITSSHWHCSLMYRPL